MDVEILPINPPAFSFSERNHPGIFSTAMFVELVLVGAVLLISLFLFWLRFARRGTRAEDNKSPNGTKFLGVLEYLKILSLILKSSRIPNYELAHSVSELYGKICVSKLPFHTEASLLVADLKTAKDIMGSAAWINRLPRTHYLTEATFNQPVGLLTGSGDDWKEARKLTLKLLHQLDVLKPKHLEKFITYEISQVEQGLRKQIEESGGHEMTLCPHQMFEIHTLNIVCQATMKTRFEHGDPVAEEMLKSLSAANRRFNAGASIVDILPWLSHIPGLTFLDSWKRASGVCYDYFRTEILEKRRSLGTYRSEPSDFADHFLLEIDKNAGSNPNYVTDEAFLVCMRDLVFAGSDTANSVMEHAILHMALEPAIQTKVQLEIDQVLGPLKTPSYDDRHSFPYTQATLLEILRIATPIPLTSRSPTEDNVIKGHHVPKGSVCAINIYSIHRSEELWEDPLKFKPERFLYAEEQHVNTEKIIPFGYGRRVCIGQPVARAMLFIFFVSLLQKFTFQLSADHPPPSMKNVMGLSRCPVPYYVKVCFRETKDDVVS